MHFREFPLAETTFLQLRQVTSILFYQLNSFKSHKANRSPPFFHSFDCSSWLPHGFLFPCHSFAHRLYSFIDSSSSPMLTRSLGLEELINVMWHGIGGRTIAKVLQYDLHIVESFKPQIVIVIMLSNEWSFAKHLLGTETRI